MTAKSKVEYESQSQENDLKDDTKSTEVSLAFGGGLGFNVGKNELGCRYKIYSVTNYIR